MKTARFKKGLIVGLVTMLVISSCSATFLWLYIKESPCEDDASDAKDALLSERGIKLLTKEFIFSEPIIEEYGENICVYVDESDLYSMSDGRPVLPVNLSIIEFPLGTEIIDVDYEYSTPENIDIAKKLSFGKCSPQGTSMDEDIYSSKDLYPINWVTYHTGGGLSNNEHRTFLVVRIYPVRYMPSKDQIKCIQQVKLDIKYKEPDTKMLDDNHICDLLIITPSEFTKSLKDLVDHKNNMGVKTKLVTVEEVYNENNKHGRDNPEKIKYYIKTAIENWGVKHVLLVGGIKGQTMKWNLPIRYSHVVPPKEQEYAEQSFISDLYYADIYDSEGNFSSWDSNNNDIFAEWNENDEDKMDLYPDVYLGRLACRNKFEVKTMVDKIIKYEKEKTSGKNWFKNFVLVAGDSYKDDEQFNEGELISEKAIELMPSFKPVKVYASETKIDRKTINKAINKGAGFIFFCGHGSATSWGTHYPPDGTEWTKFYNAIHMNLLKNKEKLPIAVIGGCLNGKFDISIMNNIKTGMQKDGLKYFLGKFWTSGWVSHCWAWKLTVKRGGGTIATISNTGLGTHGRDDTDHNSIIDYLEVLNGWQELRFIELYGKENQDILGENHGQTITEYLHRFLGNNDKMDVKMAQQWFLFGDPSLKIGGY